MSDFLFFDFEKSCNYLKDPIQLQNNKNSLDIIKNANLSSDIKSNCPADFSITSSFIEKINNTTLFELENINNLGKGESKVYSPNSSKNKSNVFKSITFENTVNPEVETDNFLNIFNKIESGDVLLLSLSGVNDKVIESAPIPNENNSKPKSFYKEKIKKIESASEDNKTLLVSEKTGKIYLPYKKAELLEHIEKNPTSYKSLQDVVEKEFILPFKFFKNQSSKTRFSETYNLLKNRNDHNFMKSVSYAFKVAGIKNLNPVIISACKNKQELDSYISCLDTNKLKDFKSFDIIYEITPL